MDAERDIATMYTIATGTRSKLAIRFSYRSPLHEVGVGGAPREVEQVEDDEQPTMTPVQRIVRDAKFAAA